MKLEKITLPIAAVATIVFVIIGWTSAYFGSVNAWTGPVSELKTNVAVHETRIQNISDNLNGQDSRMNRLENKIDALLVRQGLNPIVYNK